MSIRLSSVVLVLANLAPVAGVLLLNWDVLSIMLMYWSESVILGVINVLRMAVASNEQTQPAFDPAAPARASEPAPPASRRSFPRKLFRIAFFCVHYGAFCYGHLMAVVMIFTEDRPGTGTLADLAELWQPAYWIAVAAIFGSHLFSFFANYIGRGEYRMLGLDRLMGQPYGRIMVMQLTVIVGGALVARFDDTLAMLIVLVLAKIVLDLRLHSQEHEKLAAGGRGDLSPGKPPA
jgi:hypothetical protein